MLIGWNALRTGAVNLHFCLSVATVTPGVDSQWDDVSIFRGMNESSMLARIEWDLLITVYHLETTGNQWNSSVCLWPMQGKITIPTQVPRLVTKSANKFYCFCGFSMIYCCKYTSGLIANRFWLATVGKFPSSTLFVLVWICYVNVVEDLLLTVWECQWFPCNQRCFLCHLFVSVSSFVFSTLTFFDHFPCCWVATFLNYLCNGAVLLYYCICILYFYRFFRILNSVPIKLLNAEFQWTQQSFHQRPKVLALADRNLK